MFEFNKSDENPILVPNSKKFWESKATFNACPAVDGKTVHFLYRALSSSGLSTIGYASSTDGIHFKNRRQLIKPELDWEKFGCEDPRVVKIKDTYYIFYTALSTFPFSADGIKVGLAITKDFKNIQKYPVTPFNAKAMTLFPDKIKGKFFAILSVDTDRSQAKTCIAVFNQIEQIWSKEYWDEWYSSIDRYEIPLYVGQNDHVEVGAPPIKTKNGWLLLYSYIENYFSDEKTVFGVRAILLDLKDPMKIISGTEKALLVPQEEYEKYGIVPNIVFPSGAFVKRKKIYLYYGAADTVCCVATGNFDDLINELSSARLLRLQRFFENPILKPIHNNRWESKAVFNPAAIYEDGKIHLLYRAMSDDSTSTIGYASSIDGLHIKERLSEPVYVPREFFERKSRPNVNSGCEDPRLTKIGSRIYMFYTAYKGEGVPRVAFTSISLKDFLKKKWNWKKPVLISPPDMDDKDAALFPKKIKGKYVILHRLGNSIWIDFVKNLNFDGNTFLKGTVLMSPRFDHKDNKKIGICGPPIETSKGWLLLYHGISESDNKYHLWASLLDIKDPTKILARTEKPILEAIKSYEKHGHVSNVVFSNGAVVKNGKLFVYYGGADEETGVATIRLSELLKHLIFCQRRSLNGG